MTPTDEQLMIAIARGDQHAFATLVTRHLPRAYAIARRFFAQQTDAEDIAQEAFTRVWTHAAIWQPGRAQFSTWLQRIVVNLCLDNLRRHKHRAEQDIDSLLHELLDPKTETAATVERAREAAKIQQVVQRLPEKQRMAVLLCYFDEHSNTQAAALMGLHPKALEGLLGRARQQLRRWLPKGLSPCHEDKQR
ncbi:sigma-70 family RNA polymerase sigma factor [Pseudomonas sp. NFACC13-1]|uniref:sigma-70 family RNA polymerase sigma factor n=1 Tax=Pseudomonas sp. NFACC13-1 TaxID=1566245 RepID=UPI0008899C27|nr:sigma-70 family RNA polymerase sigma factor [Pseudomonas sp. NFACC13-1]SDB57098.1 RNA polymerase sigma-70 factor, ECF subfamily [Pseudomonas sp. NFACC13-1]